MPGKGGSAPSVEFSFSVVPLAVLVDGERVLTSLETQPNPLSALRAELFQLCLGSWPDSGWCVDVHRDLIQCHGAGVGGFEHVHHRQQ